MLSIKQYFMVFLRRFVQIVILAIPNYDFNIIIVDLFRFYWPFGDISYLGAYFVYKTLAEFIIFEFIINQARYCRNYSF